MVELGCVQQCTASQVLAIDLLNSGSRFQDQGLLACCPSHPAAPPIKPRCFAAQTIASRNLRTHAYTHLPGSFGALLLEALAASSSGDASSATALQGASLPPTGATPGGPHAAGGPSFASLSVTELLRAVEEAHAQRYGQQLPQVRQQPPVQQQQQPPGQQGRIAACVAPGGWGFVVEDQMARYREVRGCMLDPMQWDQVHTALVNGGDGLFRCCRKRCCTGCGLLQIKGATPYRSPTFPGV